MRRPVWAVDVAHGGVGSVPGEESGVDPGEVGHITQAVSVLGLDAVAVPKPIPRRDVHFGEIDDDRKDSTAPHITFRPQLGGHRKCGPAICTFHLGFSLVICA